MIDPGAIPQIPGDMDALVHHASRLRAAGQGFADTGADVHTTWQGLAPYYRAPETAQLLLATSPIADTARRIGANLDVVAGALMRYADEVRPLQHRLRQLQCQAEQPGGETSESAAADQESQIVAQVRQAETDWLEAQQRCANTITALHTSTPASQAESGGFVNDVAGTVGDWFSDHADELGSALQHGSETALGALGILAGGAMIGAGLGGEFGGALLDATGVGLPVGIPINIASAGVIAAGGTLAVGGAAMAIDGAQKLTHDTNQMFSTADHARGQRVQAPKNLSGFPGTRRVSPKTPVQGGGSLRRRWIDDEGKIYEWDSKKGEVEIYNKQGSKHLGGYDPTTGKQISPSVPGRKIEK